VVNVTADAAITSAFESARAGDELGFARLIDAYHADLIRVAFVVSRDPELAKDAVQSAWTIAWRKLAHVREPDRVKGWLVAIAANGFVFTPGE
jgi:RNA polymerase sigma-70 factor (ECF subfamily)